MSSRRSRRDTINYHTNEREFIFDITAQKDYIIIILLLYQVGEKNNIQKAPAALDTIQTFLLHLARIVFLMTFTFFS